MPLFESVRNCIPHTTINHGMPYMVCAAVYTQDASVAKHIRSQARRPGTGTL